MAKAKERLCGIYRIRRIGTEECYVGQSIDIYARWDDHRKHLKRGDHRSSRLQNVYNKYGPDVFEYSILECGCCPNDKVTLTASEQKWIDVLKPCYNHVPVAGSSRAGIKHSEETREKLSVSQRRRFSTQEARDARSAEQKRFLAEATPEELAAYYAPRKGRKSPFKGKKHTEEAKEKLSLAHKGKPSPNRGKLMSKEARDKMSLARKGKPSSKRGVPRSTEANAKQSETMKRLMAGKTLYNTGKPLPQWVKDKVSKTKRGVPWSEARRLAYEQSRQQKELLT